MDDYVQWGATTDMTLVLVGTVLLLCLLPSILFLGFWHGLARMRRSSLVTRSSARADCSDPAVTWSDVFDAYADPRQRWPSSTSASKSPPGTDERCSRCAAENAPFASFCRNCSRKLE